MTFAKSPSNPRFQSLIAMAAVAAAVGVATPALAESDIATAAAGAISASARLDFRITVPKIIFLQVGTGTAFSDVGTIDRFGPHGAAELVQQGSRMAARLQTGYLYSYAFVMLLGLVGLATWAIVR